jgi:phosphatidate cytidylyltransferase
MRRYNTNDLLKLFIIVWSTDTGAYICGKLIGGTKLAESLSPNKTVSGLLGGVYIGTCAGIFMKGTILSSSLIAFSSQCGDLIESTCKRIAGLKDSNLDGLAIPGHGGILDRIDALLFATPIAFLFSRLK